MFILKKIIKLIEARNMHVFLQIWNVKHIVHWKTKVCQALVLYTLMAKKAYKKLSSVL